MTDKAMLADLTKQHIGPLLSSVGFKERRATWDRSTDELVQVIDLQKGRKRSDGSIDVTLNIGLWIESVWCSCWGKAPPESIKESDCFPRFRVGFLLDELSPRFRDKWWLLTDKRSIESVGGEICEVIQKNCLPFFERHRSVCEVLAFAEQRLPIRLPLDRLYCAILQCLSGDREKGERLLSELAPDPHWGERVREASRRVNYTI